MNASRYRIWRIANWDYTLIIKWSQYRVATVLSSKGSDILEKNTYIVWIGVILLSTPVKVCQVWKQETFFFNRSAISSWTWWIETAKGICIKSPCLISITASVVLSRYIWSSCQNLSKMPQWGLPFARLRSGIVICFMYLYDGLCQTFIHLCIRYILSTRSILQKIVVNILSSIFETFATQLCLFRKSLYIAQVE